MTLHFVNVNWTVREFPLLFFDTEEICKSDETDDMNKVAAMNENDKLGGILLIFSGTSDNEPSVALGVYLFLSFSVSVRYM